MNVSRITIIGFLGKDPVEHRAGAGGSLSGVVLEVAYNFFKRGRSGNESKHVNWHKVFVNDAKTADDCLKFLKKGRQVFVEGEFRAFEVTDRKTGAPRMSLQIRADVVRFMGTAETNGAS